MAAEIKTSLRVRARFRWIQLGGYGTAIKLCKGNYGSPPIVLFPHGEPCGSRESGYRFVRDFIISSRDEGEEERERERNFSLFVILSLVVLIAQLFILFF